MGWFVPAYSRVVGTALLFPAFLPMNPVLSGKEGPGSMWRQMCSLHWGSSRTPSTRWDGSLMRGGSIPNCERWQRTEQEVDLSTPSCAVTPQSLTHCFPTSHSAQSWGLNHPSCMNGLPILPSPHHTPPDTCRSPWQLARMCGVSNGTLNPST